MMNDDQTIDQMGYGKLYLLRTDKSLDEIRNAIESADVVVTHLDGNKIDSREAFFSLIQKMLALPDWFGKNWDALFDSFRDLAWLGSRKLVILLSDSLTFADKEPQEYEKALYTLAAAARDNPYFLILLTGKTGTLPPSLQHTSVLVL
jgi:RNAse (barnase) inhibitor barstar